MLSKFLFELQPSIIDIVAVRQHRFSKETVYSSILQFQEIPPKQELAHFSLYLEKISNLSSKEYILNIGIVMREGYAEDDNGRQCNFEIDNDGFTNSTIYYFCEAGFDIDV